MTLRDRLMEAYWWVERRMVPGLTFAQNTYEAVLDRYAPRNGAWLDVGCGRHLLPVWRGDAARDLVDRCRLVAGIDYDLPSLHDNRTLRHRCRGDISTLPYTDGAFDLVTANMVVEHLRDPVVQFREMHRVLRPGGRFLFHTPNARGYPTVLARLVPDAPKRVLISLLEGRRGEDVFPTHYRANTGPALERLARDVGFEVERLEFILSTAMTAVVLPLAVFELLALRMMRAPGAAGMRPNIIAVLRKPDGTDPAGRAGLA